MTAQHTQDHQSADYGPVAIVGGGPAGLAAARAFLRRGIPFTVFERHHELGGLWHPENPGTPIYDSAHFISSKTLSHYSDYPMPDDYPAYPSAAQIRAYIEDFADAYGLREHVELGVGVEDAARTDSGWSVLTTDGREMQFGSLVVASGTNWHPRMPEYPGEFTGEIRHSVTYRSPGEFEGKRVLVIGAGNSGCDIACDAAANADFAMISMRRGYHFIPKFVFGQPADVFGEAGPTLPMWLEQRVFGTALRLLHGDLTKLGLQKPDHKVFESHPIMNDQLLHYLGHGDIIAAPDIARFDGKKVLFTDGREAEFDLIICATGYDWKIPFVDPAEFTWNSGRPELFLNMFHRTNDRLYVMGFIETNGGAYKLFDENADMIAQAIEARSTGDASAAKLAQMCQADRTSLGGGIKHVDSPRHAHYVESHAFRKKLAAVRDELGWAHLEPGAFARLRVEHQGAGKHWSRHLQELGQGVCA